MPLALPHPTAAQGLGSAAILGDVRDEAGEPVPFARVEAVHEPTGRTASVTTDEEGRYTLRSLRPGGPYHITVTALGYGELVQEGIALRADQRMWLDLTLSEQPIVLEALEVAPDDPRFDVTRNAPALTLRRANIEGFPTVERSFLELTALSPLAVQTREDAGYSITGQSERQNAILIDGALSQDVFGTTTSGVTGGRARAKPIPMDAIREFRVDVAPFDVRTSGFTGGVLNAMTRSGTNEWRGSLFSEYRDEQFFGDLLVDSENVAPEEYRKGLWGFDLGGPLSRDRVHVFVAAEVENRSEPAPGFTLGEHDPVRLRIAPDSLARMSAILAEEYGLAPGTAGQVSLRNPLVNTFARLDWRVSDRHSLSLWHNFAHAARDSTPNRTSFGPYEYSSAGYRVESTSHGVSGTLTSRIGDGHSNQVKLNVHRTRERSRPASDFPQVDVRITSELSENAFVRNARVGSRYFAQRDALDQTVLQLSEAFTLARDNKEATFGASLDVFRFHHDYVPGSAGYYRFDSLEDLAANRPSHYQVRSTAPGVEDSAVDFSVVQPSLFLQNENTFPGGFVLRYGVRLDVPIFTRKPRYAQAVADEFDVIEPKYAEFETLGATGIDTHRLPSGSFLVSPRMGFNYQSDRRYRTQVRGGWGVFTGRMPFSWLSNVYRDNGLHLMQLACAEAAAPALDPTGAAPLECADGSDLETAGRSRVVGFNPEFRYPRELKMSVSVDQELPGGVIASVEGILVATFGRPILKELNLNRPEILDPGYGPVFGRRFRYGDAVGWGYRPVRRVDELAQVLMIENDHDTPEAYSLTFDLEKRFGDRLELKGSYSRAVSRDRQSLLYTDQAMSFAASPVGEHLNMRPMTRSAMDRPSKFVGNAVVRLPERWAGTELSLVYVGQSGVPYSYVYGTDINGDGYSGDGIPLDASNDLLYVPDPPSSISSRSPVTRSLFSRLVEMEPCLSAAVGEIMRRNSCRSPPIHRLDLRVAQPFHVRGLRLEASADVLNVLNLLNAEWGRVWEVDPIVPILDFVDRAGGPPPGRPRLGYSGTVRRAPETSQLEPQLPHYLVLPASQWQAQIGFRVSF